MKKWEAELAKKVEDLLRAAEEADAAEDARYGKENGVPAELESQSVAGGPLLAAPAYEGLAVAGACSSNQLRSAARTAASATR